MNTKWLAHSVGKKPSVPAQSYSEHIADVVGRVDHNLDHLLKYYNGDVNFFRTTVRTAALYHDLGKLDDENQKVLSQGGSRHLPTNHVDSGTAYLLDKDFVESSLLVYSHHIGLPSIPAEQAKEGLFLRDPELKNITEENLSKYLLRHIESGFDDLVEIQDKQSDWNGLSRRIALSCLVDGDYGDTAKNYRKEFPVSCPKPRWTERLKALDRYVEGLAKDLNVAPERILLRQKLYQASREADTTPSFFACDSPVGTGKTMAVMVHLLRTAIDKNLRHIIVVLPYTNIIKQSVEDYRQALVLPDENPDEVIAEHHHQVDFDEVEVRQLSTLWQAPIIVTTAVQFFETIANNHPSRLRKLHELPGSAVFIDESHAAIPNYLWPQTWTWLNDLGEKWHCYFVLASGSLPRFWELKDLITVPERLPQLICDDLRKEAVRQERERVVPTRHSDILNVDGLIKLVLSQAGPRLVIMNTVQSAAVIAHRLASQIYGENYSIDLETSQVLHLSTALAPIHRDKIVDIVKQRLSLARENYDTNFTLIATSCVEAGVNLSFRSAFRERAGAANLLQVGGRVRRHGENFKPILIDFRIEDDLISHHPTFDISSQVLERLFDEGRVANDSPSDLVTEALRRELMSDTNVQYKRLQKYEEAGDYPAVTDLYRVISGDTKLILVDQEIINKLHEGEKIDPKELVRRSVQMWTSKIGKTCAYQIDGFPDLFGWPEDGYDEFFLGYMKGVLPILQLEEKGFGII